ncbi:hypothetical protein C4N9_04805 [Pararhodobacter marinus]|uniref:Alanine racemase N-terminal domain-containing protein n=1 Tax=Pararhodobacter marinus TaxID=2184063 RepID=A0A2U2CH23_9RHOB|nr:hypothetical protein C4N9_04805 [Pararhodobacter marinus]
MALRGAWPEAQVLLFPSSIPPDLPALSRAGVLSSVHDRASIDALRAAAPDVRVLLKLDCGLHRYGFGDRGLEPVLSLIEAGRLPRARGCLQPIHPNARPHPVGLRPGGFRHRTGAVRPAVASRGPGHPLGAG